MRRIALITTILTLAIGGVCMAGGLELYVGGGADAAVGELVDRSDFGYHGHLALGLGLTDTLSSDIRILATARHHRFAANVPTDGDRTISSAGPELRLGIPNRSQTKFYLLLGAGWARVKRLDRITCITEMRPTGPVVIESVIGGASEDNPYLSIGVAAIAGEATVRPFIEFKFTDVSGKIIKDIQFVSLTAGLRF